VAPGNEEAAKPLHNPELVEEHANQISHVVGTEQTKDHSDPSEVAQAALADPDVPLGQDADPNGPDDLRSADHGVGDQHTPLTTTQGLAQACGQGQGRAKGRCEAEVHVA
jgi:hypothetical protein